MPVQNYELLDTNTDVTTTRTLLHEVIPMTGSIYRHNTGAYNDENIKNYTHGMFQSVYDYPYLSSSANHIFDITVGYDEESALSSSTSVQNTKKINLYNQFSQTLLGYTGSTTDGVRKFESDLTLDGTGAMKECVFISLSRLLVKDQIKKGSFSITLGTGSYANPFTATVPHTTGSVFQDISASVNSNTTNTVGGDYGLLFLSGANAVTASGVVFYQAGVVVLTASVFNGVDAFTTTAGGPGFGDVKAALTGAAISASCDGFRHRVMDI